MIVMAAPGYSLGAIPEDIIISFARRIARVAQSPAVKTFFLSDFPENNKDPSH